MTSPVSEDLYGIAGFGPRDVYAVGAAGTILHYDGVAWTQIVSPTTVTLRAVSAYDRAPIAYAGGNVLARASQLVAVGDSGVVVVGQP
jgi:hypothetical protein